MARHNTNAILEMIDNGLIDPKQFLESLLSAMSEAEVTENIEYISRVEDWPEEYLENFKLE